jgi:hypothetical protein
VTINCSRRRLLNRYHGIRIDAINRHRNEAETTIVRYNFTFPPNFDDQIGSASELRLSMMDLKLAAFRKKHQMSLDFRGDGGSYTVSFELTKPE